jgi:hypothetical protein
MNNSLLTVTTASQTFDLTTLATVKDELEVSDKKSDARLRRYIRSESDRIAAFCNRVFALETVQQTFRLERRQSCLILDRIPVTTIISVTEDDTEIDSTLYEFGSASGLLYRLESSSSAERDRWCADKIVVSYSGGYELLGTLPPAIEEACISLVKARWFARRRDPLLKVRDVDQVIRQEFWVGGADDGLPEEVKSALMPYRRIIL